MYSADHIREELEDELYQDGDSEGSEVNSEMEFHLYSQLHYSSNAAEMEEQGDDEEKENDRLGLDNQQHEMLGTTGSGDSNLPLKNDNKLSSSNDDSLQPTKKKKKVKKQKIKKKTDSKDQRLSSLCCEEVIVIDSSPDCISISDESSDDDDGVCSLKGQGSHKLLTSTPAQQEIQKRKRSSDVPVTVVSCSSADSESTLESDSSDSDGLENWMLLGQGMQDGDQSISLNLEGGSVSSADFEGGGTWLVSEKDKEAQIYNKGNGPRITVQRVSNRYYTNKNVHCRNCNKTGHISKNCSESNKLLPCYLCGTAGHAASECPNKHCRNCGQPGHCFDSCREKAYWYKQCHRCSIKGHFIDACPEIWRQYHITVSIFSLSQLCQALLRSHSP
ncbi:zinc finger CCHC domain-containing protein 7 [Austrofundulus limnaeus]|uniref:Zinc finger CCHC domain-containing protein 7 n=1 Tax=Austrofundulus limnaeus TaxID=52670 RepID=A0A2I4BLU7_AUSLI|nr:PREDICTED: zinc finger CCHC domain-containing protein 7 [Austrofundulus limnaeus]XP_013868718.1 PREDICTED: zinc finger CCHC domain-containing protein 7 [Austrofundulus limnaeus]